VAYFLGLGVLESNFNQGTIAADMKIFIKEMTYPRVDGVLDPDSDLSEAVRSQSKHYVYPPQNVNIFYNGAPDE